MNHHHHFHESSTLPRRRTAENARYVFFIILLIFPLSESRKNIWECLRPSVWECNWGLFLNLSASNFSHETSIKPCAKTFTAYGVSTCWLLMSSCISEDACMRNSFPVDLRRGQVLHSCYNGIPAAQNLFRSQKNGVAAFSSDLLSLKCTPRDSHAALQESYCFLP